MRPHHNAIGVRSHAPARSRASIDILLSDIDRLGADGYRGLRLSMTLCGDNLDQLTDVARLADYPCETFLLDAFVPGPGPRGGRGRSFDRSLAAAAAREHRVILAGGLTPGNVAEAIRLARPVMVDVSSGVESAPGVKDPEKLRAVLAGARAGFAAATGV